MWVLICDFTTVQLQLQLASSRVQSNITQISTEQTSVTIRCRGIRSILFRERLTDTKHRAASLQQQSYFYWGALVAGRVSILLSNKIQLFMWQLWHVFWWQGAAVYRTQLCFHWTQFKFNPLIGTLVGGLAEWPRST